MKKKIKKEIDSLKAGIEGYVNSWYSNLKNQTESNRKALENSYKWVSEQSIKIYEMQSNLDKHCEPSTNLLPTFYQPIQMRANEWLIDKKEHILGNVIDTTDSFDLEILCGIMEQYAQSKQGDYRKVNTNNLRELLKWIEMKVNGVGIIYQAELKSLWNTLSDEITKLEEIKEEQK